MPLLTYGMATIRNAGYTSYWRGREQLELLPCWWDRKWYIPLKTAGQFLIKSNIQLPYDQQSHPEERKLRGRGNLYEVLEIYAPLHFLSWSHKERMALTQKRMSRPLGNVSRRQAWAWPGRVGPLRPGVQRRAGVCAAPLACEAPAGAWEGRQPGSRGQALPGGVSRENMARDVFWPGCCRSPGFNLLLLIYVYIF